MFVKKIVIAACALLSSTLSIQPMIFDNLNDWQVQLITLITEINANPLCTRCNENLMFGENLTLQDLCNNLKWKQSSKNTDENNCFICTHQKDNFDQNDDSMFLDQENTNLLTDTLKQYHKKYYFHEACYKVFCGNLSNITCTQCLNEQSTFCKDCQNCVKCCYDCAACTISGKWVECCCFVGQILWYCFKNS